MFMLGTLRPARSAADGAGPLCRRRGRSRAEKCAAILRTRTGPSATPPGSAYTKAAGDRTRRAGRVRVPVVVVVVVHGRRMGGRGEVSPDRGAIAAGVQAARRRRRPTTTAVPSRMLCGVYARVREQQCTGRLSGNRWERQCRCDAPR